MQTFRVMSLAVAAAFFFSAPASAEPVTNPMRFFEGRTESSGTIKVFMKQAYRSHSFGSGRIEPDGTLVLVQQVRDEGRPPRERRWKIRQVGPGRFLGSMSEAAGPVSIEEVGGSYRFSYKMKGNLSVVQLLVPLAGGTVARSTVKIRKFGVTVGAADGTIRKVAGR